ncbi:MAG TPA: potassium transporter TrkA, partial [Propionibacteriaceae bacterium]|nr:potassium transporter TrkA [Propionibacteriaceae bacterium]
MFNPILVFLLRTSRTPRPRGVDPELEAIPTAAPSTDAIFLVLRRMRLPLILLVVLFAISVFGLALTPGANPDGSPWRMSVFDAFYFMSYTATT